MGLTNKQLQPLYDILPGDIELNSPRQLTDSAGVVLNLVEKGIQTAALKRRDLFSPIILWILPSETQPTGVLLQGAPLLWIHPKIPPPERVLLLSCLGCPIGIAGFTAMRAAFWHPS